jgi:hypothetical protein
MEVLMMDYEELPPPPELPDAWTQANSMDVEAVAVPLRAIAEQLAWITMSLSGGPAGGPPLRKEAPHG